MNTKTIYGLIMNTGDGSYGIVWIKDKELANTLLKTAYFECNEGEFAQILHFPYFMDLEACGFTFDDREYD